MNLSKLFEMQSVLDQRIDKDHPRQDGENRAFKKILALLTELGELANELPEIFKFWSNKKNNYEKALMEYVDGLHFVLGLGIEMKMDHIDAWFVKHNVLVFTEGDVTEQFFATYSQCVKLKEYELGNAEDYEDLLYSYIALGEKIGFTWEQIQAAYFAKNQINHARQDSGVY